MHFSLFDLIIKNDNFTVSVAHMDNGTIGSALFGISIIKVIDVDNSRYVWLFHMDAFFTFFFYQQFMLLKNKLLGKKDEESKP